MSVNDPDGQPYKELAKEEFIKILIDTGWMRKAAEEEWERFDKPVLICDLTW